MLKLNVRQLINKKSKRKKSSISFLTPNESPDLVEYSNQTLSTTSNASPAALVQTSNTNTTLQISSIKPQQLPNGSACGVNSNTNNNNTQQTRDNLNNTGANNSLNQENAGKKIQCIYFTEKLKEFEKTRLLNLKFFYLYLFN